MNKQIVGILAHVDAGKTTLSEALLYVSGKIKKFGRVDRRDTFLDTHEIERERGITVFSKMASFETEKINLTLLDTPGHVDFSSETERTLAVLDYALFVISGSEGVEAHTETLWHLLAKYNIPTFVFVTKMDLSGADRENIMQDLTRSLSQSCVDFSSKDDLGERIALCDEEVLEKYMSDGEVTKDDIRKLICERKLFPCFFGSGLRVDGIDEIISALEEYTEEKRYPEEFGARVYKIAHERGVRLTFLKVTGGGLKVRDSIKYKLRSTEEFTEEKITAIRLYSGAKFESVESVAAGKICAVVGLSESYAGQGLGAEEETRKPYIEPVLNYKITLPKEADPRVYMAKLRELEEEEPLLHIVWNERYAEINAQIMGQVQTEILTRTIHDRFGIDVTFDDGRIMYRETVSAPSEGVGHYEPLRHYAEVHVLIEPAERGSGISYESAVDESFLERNWQRLILTHLEEKQHIGPLTGSPITDVKLTLVSGRAHLKHTEGGDFRESTYRAVRQGLMCSKARSEAVLLEPYFAYRLEVPSETVGRAISDIISRHGSYDEHEASVGTSVLSGKIPVSEVKDYALEVSGYTHGKGRFSCIPDGYYPCHNADEVIAKIGYVAESDMDNPSSSVFCSHGAGFAVPWYSVHEYMHLEGLELKKDEIEPTQPKVIKQNLDIDEKELDAIMEREFGPIKRRVYSDPKKPQIVNTKLKEAKKSLYIIDGYNVIFAWDELKDIAEYSLENARRALCDILANYKAFTKKDMILVFDAYNVKGAVERKTDYLGLYVVYTKEGELGDTYIEKLVSNIGKDYNVRVITSDGLIQLQAVRSGVLRMSAREFREEVLSVDTEIKEILEKLRGK